MLEIKSAGERAASLTQQLLAFSRRQVLQPKVLDLNAIVADFDKLLRRLVGERIKVAVNCEADLWQVRADPGEIGRAIMNLFLNARDAMPDGGTLTIETANVILAEAAATDQDLAPGRYVTLAVRDTGVGMELGGAGYTSSSRSSRPKRPAKEPAWASPPFSELSSKAAASSVASPQLGEGTTFTIFLPAVAEAVDKGAHRAGGLAKAPTGSEVILLVEDEDIVRVLARRVLEASGYVVLEARNGREGLALCQSHEGPIDLLVSDVVMPELGGRELAERALKLRPDMKVMFMSGHTQDVVLKEGVEKGTAFLQKPFTPAGLAKKVRETLDAKARPAGLS